MADHLLSDPGVDILAGPRKALLNAVMGLLQTPAGRYLTQAPTTDAAVKGAAAIQQDNQANPSTPPEGATPLESLRWLWEKSMHDAGVGLQAGGQYLGENALNYLIPGRPRPEPLSFTSLPGVSPAVGTAADLATGLAAGGADVPGAGLTSIKAAIRAGRAVHNAEDIMGLFHLPEPLARSLARTTKVLDAEGNPIRVLHGTDVTYVDPNLAKANRDALVGPGYYTTEGNFNTSKYVGGMSFDQAKADLIYKYEQQAQRAYDRIPAGLEGTDRKVHEIGAQTFQQLADKIRKATNLSEVPSTVRSEMEDMLYGGMEPVTSGYSAGTNATRGLGDEHAPQVRSQYLDIQKPLNLDTPWGMNDVNSIAHELSLVDPKLGQTFLDHFDGMVQTELRRAKLLDAPPEVKPFIDRALGDPNMSALDIRKFEQQMVEAGLSPEDAKTYTSRLVDMNSSRRFGASLGARDPISSYDTGWTIYNLLTDTLGGDKQLANLTLQAAGYDGITHLGGAITGGVPHRVWVAFDPSQIYGGDSGLERLTAEAIKRGDLTPEEQKQLMQIIDARTASREAAGRAVVAGASGGR